jgi:hypothetical protein
MNIFEFYKILSNKEYSGVNIVNYSGYIDKMTVQNIVKEKYLNDCMLEFNFFVFDFKEVFNKSQFKETIKSVPMGCLKKFIICFSLGELNKNDIHFFVDILKKSSDIDLLAFSKKSIKNIKAFNTVNIEEISKRPSSIKNMIKELCSIKNISISSDKIDHIAKLYGNDTDQISSLLDKLKLAGKEICENDDLFYSLTGIGIKISSYRLTKSILEKNLKEIENNIDNLIAWGIHPNIYIAILRGIFLKMVFVFNGEKLSNDYLKDSYELVSKGLNYKKIKKLFDLFYDFEYILRRNKLEKDIIKLYTLQFVKGF